MTSFEQAYSEIAVLVAQFEANEAHYLSPKYQEAEVREDYINKFWSALGWDVRHQYQTNPREQEVKVEKNPDASASGRRADYAFYHKPDYKNPIFFVEAKKPSRKLADPEFYFQLVRYGRGAATPVSVLTDFEEFHIVDCRYEANRQKSYPSAQIAAFRYHDYLDREKFGYIYWLFSREAIEAGKLKEFSKELPKQRGKGAAKLTADEAKPTDEAFLTKLEEYRLALAKAFKKADETLDAEALTEATQKVIDRLVFIRFLEDKNIEQDYIIDQIAGKKNATWKSFLAWSKELDVKYNGIVFKPNQIDKPTFKAPDDAVFGQICNDISHNQSKYIFSYIPIELLGSIYERFLGKVVTATAKRADIEYKPEVRKAGGVYYTPKYIVDYIVENTVGKILFPGKESRDAESGMEWTVGRRLNPAQISKLRFADIACGSGSFLIAVYDKVLHHIESYYNRHHEEAQKAGCIEIDKGIYALSLKQKQQILLDNIFGVDIDSQAVEVAQLSLFLKLLEGESGASAGQMSFEKTKILPDLSKNIVCGNSLVDYDIETLFKLTPEEEHRIKPFSFESAFKDVMAKGGFDAIVGNPPYVRQESLGELKNYFQKNYKVFQGTADLYTYFIERGVSLLKPAGRFSYIVGNKWMKTSYGVELRKWLKFQALEEVIDFADLQVFKGATTYTCILTIKKDKPSDLIRAANVETLLFGNLEAYLSNKKFDIHFNILTDSGWSLTNKSTSDLLSKMKETGVHLGDLVGGKIFRGLITGLNEAFVISAEKRNELLTLDVRSDEIIKPFLAGRDIKRYEHLTSEKYIITIPSGYTNSHRDGKDSWTWFANTYPAIATHLKPFEKAAQARWDKGEYWWELRSCDYYNEFQKPKLFLPDISQRGNFAIDNSGGFFSVNTVYFISSDDLFLMGVLNSRLMTFFYSNNFSIYSGGYLRFFTQYLKLLPIPNLDLTNPLDKSRHDALVSLVDQMLDTKKRLPGARSESERTQLERKCTYLDHEIDKRVYELYDLTKEEIAIVEGTK